MRVSVIIPMYNESKIIEATARALSSFMSEHFEDYEIIFFDDGSTDNCRELVAALDLPCVRAMGYEQNHGKGCAVRHGMLAAQGELRIFTDADLAYGTAPILAAYRQMSEDSSADILLGSRNIGKDGYEGYTWKRKVMSKLYIKVLCLVGGFKMSDSQCGFKAFRGECANEIFSECTVDGFAFDFEAILRGVKKSKVFCEMPVKVINHRASSVKPISDAFRMLKDLRRIKKNIKKGC